MRSLASGPRVLVSAFTISGVIHLVRPKVFESIVPPKVPRKREIVYVSGVAELLCAAGLIIPQSRPYAGVASAALLVAVFPANVQMALDSHRAIDRKGSTPRRQAVRAAAIARLPLQVPLIRWALRS